MLLDEYYHTEWLEESISVRHIMPDENAIGMSEYPVFNDNKILNADGICAQFEWQTWTEMSIRSKKNVILKKIILYSHNQNNAIVRSAPNTFTHFLPNFLCMQVFKYVR